MMLDNNKLSDYKEIKIRIVSELIECLRLNYDWSLSHKILFFLIDNFKDESIIPSLFEITLREGIEKVNGTIIFACQEYSPNDCKYYFQDLVEIVIHSNYEASWSASTLINKFPPPYNIWESGIIREAIFKLESAFTNVDDPNFEFISHTLSFIKLWQ